jgi:transposase, IS5 family
LDTSRIPPRTAVQKLEAVLDSPEIAGLIEAIEALHWTGRPGYGVKAMVGMMLAKSIYGYSTWSKFAALVSEHDGLQAMIGCAPSQWACYRFATKLREHSDKLAACIEAVIASLSETLPDMGVNVAIDGSDLPAYANGQRYLSKNGPERERYSDPDATWGHRSAVSTRKGGGYYGYKVHAAVDTATDLPLAWVVQPANVSEQAQALDLIDTTKARGFEVRTAIADKGYDSDPFHTGCMDRGVAPVTALRQTDRVVRGENKPPECEHGVWKFAGADAKRRRTKWRCPTGICTPASLWVKADRLHPLIPRESKRSRDLYRSRGAVEREFGRLKNDWAMLPLHVRRLERVRLHVDLTVLAKLSCRLASERAIIAA